MGQQAPNTTKTAMSKPHRAGETISIGERYLAHLETPSLGDDGKLRERAPKDFVSILRAIHKSHKPKFDLTECLSRANGFIGNIWFWSDQHFCHRNIIRFCDRPFNSVEEMNRSLLENCLARVQQEDIVIFGGDVMMKDLQSANEILREIPGHKVLVLGNHDCQGEAVLLLEVDEVAPWLEINFEGRSIFVSHYPLSEHLLDFRQINLHGHIHNNPLPSTLGAGNRHVNMSVERTNYAPMLLCDLLHGR